MEWYQKSVDEALSELHTSRAGLTEDEAGKRLARYGPNMLKAEKKESRVLKFLKSFTEFIIVVLMAAAVIAGVLGEWVDTLAILAIVVLNAVISFTQEEKAEKVLEHLRKLSAPNAKVIRDGALRTIPAGELVPGDVVSLDAGDSVPADCRVIESRLLRVEEAALTGESHPVDKDPGRLENTLPLGDRINMAYSSTVAVYGRGLGLVIATGMQTEMGKIARMLESVKAEPTPLQKKLAQFGRLLVYAAGAICGLIFVLGILRGDDPVEMFLTSVSLAVAAIPEGLPAVVTIVLALGVQRMVKRNALIRKLPSVETLGSATIIASDKTGTLTQNQMTVRRLYLSSAGLVQVTGIGYGPEGAFLMDSKEADIKALPSFFRAMQVARLCTSAELKSDPEKGWHVIGDPTEGALLSLALKSGLGHDALKKGLEYMGEIPFDSERKMMTTVYRDDAGTYHAFIKGAPDMVLPLCSGLMTRDGQETLREEKRRELLSTNEAFAKDALRVLALAWRSSAEPLDFHSLHSVERELTFVGLAGMIDPPREEVKGAVAKAEKAGITPIMITGDHKLTATAIAKELGIFREGDRALTGEELDRLPEEEFEKLLPAIKVYARVNPEHKLRVVKAWRKRGDIIAMTGDGVNDAPALKEADIGVAMGITGTDVTKEAGDMVLTDDNFASIVSAVEEGRGIFDNIRKVVHFLLSCNVGEILVLLIASLAGMPLPLLPIHILWMNLVTDGLPALGLAMEEVDKGVMDRKPRPRDEGIVTGSLIWVMALQGLFMAVCTLAVYAVELKVLGASVEKARTMAFMVLVFCQMFHVFNCRSEWRSVFSLGVFSNRMLGLAVLVILVTQTSLAYIPWLEGVFKVTPLYMRDWAFVFSVAVLPLVLMEAVKFGKGAAGAKGRP